MDHKLGQYGFVLWLLVAVMLVGCVGQPITPQVILNPTSEILPVEPTALPPTAVVEPTLRPSATQAPLAPTQTPFPSATPVATIVFPELTGDYLGQELPAMTPVIFAPGIISTGMNERDIAISPDGNELFYSIVGKGFSVILFMRRVNEVWSQPQAASFSGVYMDQEPAFSPDGQRLFFASNRPQNGSGPGELGFRIFYVERETDGWGSPQSVGDAINLGLTQSAPSVAEDGTLYFSANYPTGLGLWDIYRSRLVNGVYQAPENLGAPINSPDYDHNLYIAPDQSYMIFTRNAIEVSRIWQQADGSWTNKEGLNSRFGLEKARSVWEVTVSPDGKVIFLSANFRLMPELPSAPLGFDSIAEEIGDPKKIKDLDGAPVLQSGLEYDIFWLSGDSLKGLED
jgi:hypothetical protein